MGSGGSLPGHTLGADPEAELDPFCALGPALVGFEHQQYGGVSTSDLTLSPS